MEDDKSHAVGLEAGIQVEEALEGPKRSPLEDSPAFS
jgi:hypothetical protein